MMFNAQMAHNNQQVVVLPSRQEASSKRILTEMIETQMMSTDFSWAMRC